MSKHIIVYHDHCNDGFGAAFIAHQHLVSAGHEVELIPAQYGKTWCDLLPYNPDRFSQYLHILDFSFPVIDMKDICNTFEKVIWLDHHKTAIDAWFDSGAVCPQNLYYWLTDKHSGAMLSYFHYNKKVSLAEVPQWVKYIDDRDRWIFQYPQTKAFHAGTSSYPRTIENWKVITDPCADIIEEGNAVLRYQDQLYAQLMETAHEITIDGIKGLACNVPGQFASDIGHHLTKRSGTFGACYSADGKGYKFSLRSEGSFDVSAIAKKFGGGGHLNAAGFSISHPVDVAASGFTLWSTVDPLTQYVAEAGGSNG